MSRLALVFAFICATASLAGAEPIAIDKISVTPVQLADGPHAGKTRFLVDMTTTKKVELHGHALLAIEMTCRTGASNRTATTIAYQLNKAGAGQPLRHKYFLFDVRPLAKQPNRCTIAFKLNDGLTRRPRTLKSLCYTGSKKLVAKACTKMHPPIMAEQRPRPVVSVR